MRKVLLAAVALVTIPAAAHAQVEYRGFYGCAQGLTDLDLIVPPAPMSTIFAFGPTPSNPYVPNGGYYMQGHVDSKRMNLVPTTWIRQPPGYVMVGLSGVSRDGGNTFEGNVTGGVNCTVFSLHRVSGALPAPRPPAPPAIVPPVIRQPPPKVKVL
jgi:hypothetical protein